MFLKNSFPHFFNISPTIRTYCEIKIFSHAKYIVIHMSYTLSISSISDVHYMSEAWARYSLKQTRSFCLKEVIRIR